MVWGDDRFKQLRNELFHRLCKSNGVLQSTSSLQAQFQLQEEVFFAKKKQEALSWADQQETESRLLDSDWELGQHAPETIREFLSQIRLLKGEFVDFAYEVKAQIGEPANFRAEKMRKTFMPDFKKLWDQNEFLIILVVLYHSGLVQLSLASDRQYILDQMQYLAQPRNKIFNRMLSMVQSEREWQHTLEDINEHLAQALTQWEEKQKKIKQKELEDQEAQKKAIAEGA